MSRVSDDDLRRLSSALLTSAKNRKAAGRGDAAAQRGIVDRLQVELGRKAGDEALGRSLTQSLAAYLGRPVRAVAGGATGVIPGAWRYVAKNGPIQWWIEFEAPLAACLADAMLGGEGINAKSGAGRRVRSLVGKIADLFLEALSAIVEAPPPLKAVWTDAALESGSAQLAGRCAVSNEAFSWQAGVGAIGEAGVEFVVDQAPPSRPDRPPLAEPSEVTAISEVRDTVAAACAGLFEVLGCQVNVARPIVTEVEAPEVPEAALRLALTTGGKGALIVCAQRDAVVAFASGAVGGRIPDSGEIGSVVCAAAEAVLREVVQGIASRLSPISGAPQRTVHIAADAQLARTQHLLACVTLHVAGSVANLLVLVPRWMAVAA